MPEASLGAVPRRHIIFLGTPTGIVKIESDEVVWRAPCPWTRLDGRVVTIPERLVAVDTAGRRRVVFLDAQPVFFGDVWDETAATWRPVECPPEEWFEAVEQWRQARRAS